MILCCRTAYTNGLVRVPGSFSSCALLASYLVSQIVRFGIMAFMYNSLMDASDTGYTVRWISFSKLGEYLAVGTSRSITVWSVESGAPLAEDLSTKAIDPLCMTWVSRLSFVVGTQNGCLYSFDIIVEDKVGQLVIHIPLYF